MRRIAIVVLLITLQTAAFAAVPSLFEEKAFTAATFAQAVNHYVSLGEEAAVDELRDMAADQLAHPERGFDISERIGWLTRVLFESKTGRPLRPPMFGGLNLPVETMREASWPLYPVAFSGSTYFVLSEGYFLAGKPEDTGGYIDYCRKAGIFRKKLLDVPVKARALADAVALRRSMAWKAIKWTRTDEAGTWEFIRKQAEYIQ